mmetsp:Transcript_39402/g.92308  ORF Transcript_39402/g.92308 Transcript_39402/m.92308 type:complete len:247 (-) Transcript_39402:82-822(-)
MGRQSSFNAVRPRWHRGQVGSRKSPHNLRIDYPVHAEGELHKERQPLASTWTMLKQSLSRILFQAPTPSYGPTDFPGELVWIPRTRWHSRPTSHPDDAAIPALLMRSPSARYLVVYFHCNGVDLGMCRGFCNVLRKQFRVHVYKKLLKDVCGGCQVEEQTTTQFNDFATLALAPTVFCASSTFCLWAGMGNPGTVYFPGEFMADGQCPEMGRNFVWVKDRSLGNGLRHEMPESDWVQKILAWVPEN